MATVRLRVLNGDGDAIEIRDGVPRTRAECKNGPRPCPYIRCQYHLWLDTYDEHWNSPTGKPQRPSKLRPRWLESPMPPSCALDIADQTRESGRVLEYSKIGKLMAKHPNFIEAIVAGIRGRRPRGGAR